tara:strand:+ start:361 stop:642 length:282 start_codon:yes stop_codon:yes gene_type:complete
LNTEGLALAKSTGPKSPAKTGYAPQAKTELKSGSKHLIVSPSAANKAEWESNYVTASGISADVHRSRPSFGWDKDDNITRSTHTTTAISADFT